MPMYNAPLGIPVAFDTVPTAALPWLSKLSKSCLAFNFSSSVFASASFFSASAIAFLRSSSALISSIRT
jgi:hypothetical protein